MEKGSCDLESDLDLDPDSDLDDIPLAVAPVAIDPDVDVEDLDSDVDLDGDEYKIETLEGIGPKTGNLLRGYDVVSVGDYLRKLHSPLRRERAADDLGILVKPLHEWASMSDLLRVSGIDHQDAELLFVSDILTVADLAEQSADDLVAEMERVNNAGKQLISPVVPLEDDVRSWIASARGMNAVVSV